MLVEQKIRMFLEAYNSRDKIHSRALKMMLESSERKENVLGIADELIENSINVKNLETLKKSIQEDVETASEGPLFSVNPNFNLKVANYLSKSQLADSSNLPENFYDLQCKNDNLEDRKISDNRDSSEHLEDRHKRLKPNNQDTPDSGQFSIPGLDDDVIDDYTEAAYLFPAKNELNYLEPNFLVGVDKTKSVCFSGTSRNDFNSSNSIKSNIKHGEAPVFDVPQSKEKAFCQDERPPYTARLGSPDSNGKLSTNSTFINTDELEKDYVFYNNIISNPEAMNAKPRDPCYLYPVLQCKLCGLRFFKGSIDEFGLHIEDHRRKTKALGERTVLRREFFNLNPVIKIEKLDLAVEGDTELVVWTKEPPSCVVCRKIIKKIWNDDLENWILDNGVEINEKEFAHKKCIM